jgi:hypothetical protein
VGDAADFAELGNMRVFEAVEAVPLFGALPREVHHLLTVAALGAEPVAVWAAFEGGEQALHM